MLGDLLAERRARKEALAHLLERDFRRSDSAHAVVDAARPKAALRDLEATAFAEQDVARRHANIFENDLGVAVRRIVKAEHRQHAQHFHAGSVERHEDLRLLFVLLSVEIRLAHHDCDLAVAVANARRPPFAAVDDVLVAIAFDAGLDVGGVRRRRQPARS